METSWQLECVFMSISCRSISKAPLVAHATTSSDIYKGFYIPKGMSTHERGLVVVTINFDRGNHFRKYVVCDSEVVDNRGKDSYGGVSQGNVTRHSSLSQSGRV